MTSSYIRRRKRIRFSLHAPDFDKSCCIHFPQSGRKHSHGAVRLELEDVLVAVSQLAESSLDLSLLHAVLGSTDSSVLAGARVLAMAHVNTIVCMRTDDPDTHGPQTKNLVLAFSLWSLGKYLEIISLVTKPFSPVSSKRSSNQPPAANVQTRVLSALTLPEHEGRVVQGVDGLEPVRVLLGEFVPLLSQNYESTRQRNRRFSGSDRYGHKTR